MQTTTKLVLCLLLCTSSAYAETTKMHTSWYGPGLQGNLMANGKRFDMHDPSVAAHKHLPFGTHIQLTNPETGTQHVVVVQDRGPYIAGRQLDVSKAAAAKLGFEDDGVVTLTAIIIIRPQGSD